MIIFAVSIILFNTIVIKMKRQLTKNQIVHIWTFTMLLEMLFDIFVDEKLNGYWYFWRGIDWTNVLAYSVLIPPVNVMFLNWFPFQKSLLKRGSYLVGWVIFILMYEYAALLPQPWGYFHYGWWNVYYSIVCDPILFLILLGYFKWIRKIERLGENNDYQN